MNKNNQKDFRSWLKIKEDVHYRKSLRSIREGEIWWCKIGENVGSEICGKGKDFLRPVLIITKLSKYNFIGVPLTSREHRGSWYVPFVFRNKKEYAVVAQVENTSVYRLHYRMGQVWRDDLEKVVEGLVKLLLKNKS